MNNRKGLIKLCLCLGIIVTSILFVMVLPIWHIDIIEFSTTNSAQVPYYNQRDIEIIMGISDSTHILEITQDKIDKAKKQLPFLEELKIEKIFPNQAIIIVTERIPVAYLNFTGRYLLINKEGIVLDEQQERYLALPVIEGIKVENFVLGENIAILDDEKMLVMEIILKELEKYDMIEDIATINISNLDEIHLYIKKLDVIMGNIDDFGRKIAWLSNIYEDYTIGILDLSNIVSGSAVLRPLE